MISRAIQVRDRLAEAPMPVLGGARRKQTLIRMRRLILIAAIAGALLVALNALLIFTAEIGALDYWF